jgi:hypothetical protein
MLRKTVKRYLIQKVALFAVVDTRQIFLLAVCQFSEFSILPSVGGKKNLNRDMDMGMDMDMDMTRTWT